MYSIHFTGVGRRRPTLRMSNAIACQSDYSYAVWAFCVCLRAALIPHTLTHFVISTKLHFAVTSGINKFYVSKCLSVRSVRLFSFHFPTTSPPHSKCLCDFCVAVKWQSTHTQRQTYTHTHGNTVNYI